MVGRPCKACGAALIWIRLAGSKKPTPKPLDAKPTTGGNIRILAAGNDEMARVIGGDELRRAKEDGELLYTSHFVTCPDAHQFRKPSPQGSLL